MTDCTSHAPGVIDFPSQAEMRKRQRLANCPLDTPAFIYEESTAIKAAMRLSRLCSEAGCQLLYTLKPLNMAEVLELLRPHVAGFSASSLFEAITAREVISDQGSVHITTPGFRPDEIGRIAEICDYIAFNSLSQWVEFSRQAADKAKCGLRVNPKMSFVEDERYDPCRRHSKLGVPIDRLSSFADHNADLLAPLTGLHFHTNCDSVTAIPLTRIVRMLDSRIPEVLESLEWINLGGGYLFLARNDKDMLRKAVDILRDRSDLQVFIEPGSAIVRDACCLVATAIDLFDSDGEAVAVLDASVNHMPEVFEYQFSPEVAGSSQDASHNYLLVGCTCLAGDVFGRYAFPTPLDIGSRIIFLNMGAYTTVKWHCFNGVNLPSVYAWTDDQRLLLKHEFTYEDYSTRFGGKQHAATGTRD